MIKDFLDFLKEYGIIGLAIAFVMGTATTNLVNALVKGVIMPAVSPFLVKDWSTAVLKIGEAEILYGSFIAELLNFVILALVVFILFRQLPRRIGLKVGEKKA